MNCWANGMAIASNGIMKLITITAKTTLRPGKWNTDRAYAAMADIAKPASTETRQTTKLLIRARENPESNSSRW